MAFTNEQLERYSRHIILKEVGAKGQKKLLNAKVLVIGAGGLGAPVAMYLAAAGVGTIGIVDADVVDLSNLQRQIIHATQDVGKPKVQSAKETMNEMNPDVTVNTSPEELAKKIDNGDPMTIVDVREPHERAILRFPNAIVIPIGQLARRQKELDPNKDTVFICKQGKRSILAINTLREAGYTGPLYNPMWPSV